jgi:hypothetical protein
MSEATIIDIQFEASSWSGRHTAIAKVTGAEEMQDGWGFTFTPEQISATWSRRDGGRWKLSSVNINGVGLGVGQSRVTREAAWKSDDFESAAPGWVQVWVWANEPTTD